MSKIQTQLDTVLLRARLSPLVPHSFDDSFSSLKKSLTGPRLLTNGSEFQVKRFGIGDTSDGRKAGLFPSKNKERHFQEEEGARVFTSVSQVERCAIPSLNHVTAWEATTGHTQVTERAMTFFDSQDFDQTLDGEIQMKKIDVIPSNL